MTLEKLIQTLKESGQSIADSVMAPKELKITKDVVIAESIKLTSKDIYRAYWHCRDFEITHLWQRSVFLTAFIVLCFSAYGCLAADMLSALRMPTDTPSVAQAAKALEDGADEIEAVINLNHLKDHKYNLIHEELSQLRELLGDKTLKVIVEMQAIEDSEKASIAKVLEENKVDFIKTSTGFIAPDNIYSKVNDINIIQKYAPQLKIEIYGGVDTYKLANQLLTGGADLIGSNCGYEIVEKYRTLRENTQVTPKPIRFD